MGAGQSDLYKGTYGDNPDNIPDELKGKVKLPKDESQLRHIMRDGEGHFHDSSENRTLLEELSNNPKTHVGKDELGKDWHASYNEDGSQNWVSHKDGIIQNGGINKIPREFDEKTGLNHNVERNSSWRKKK